MSRPGRVTGWVTWAGGGAVTVTGTPKPEKSTVRVSSPCRPADRAGPAEAPGLGLAVRVGSDCTTATRALRSRWRLSIHTSAGNPPLSPRLSSAW